VATAAAEREPPVDPAEAEFPEALRVALARSGLSSKEAAVAAGLTPQTLGDWRRGRHRPNRTSVERLAAAIGAPELLALIPEEGERQYCPLPCGKEFRVAPWEVRAGRRYCRWACAEARRDAQPWNLLQVRVLSEGAGRGLNLPGIARETGLGYSHLQRWIWRKPGRLHPAYKGHLLRFSAVARLAEFAGIEVEEAIDLSRRIVGAPNRPDSELARLVGIPKRPDSELGRFIFERWSQSGQSPAAFARSIGIGHSTLSRLLDDRRPGRITLARLSAAFGEALPYSESERREARRRNLEEAGVFEAAWPAGRAEARSAGGRARRSLTGRLLGTPSPTREQLRQWARAVGRRVGMSERAVLAEWEPLLVKRGIIKASRGGRPPVDYPERRAYMTQVLASQDPGGRRRNDFWTDAALEVSKLDKGEPVGYKTLRRWCYQEGLI
jgi:transcriptional regulator with XRE-family HTH domain